MQGMDLLASQALELLGALAMCILTVLVPVLAMTIRDVRRCVAARRGESTVDAVRGWTDDYRHVVRMRDALIRERDELRAAVVDFDALVIGAHRLLDGGGVAQGGLLERIHSATRSSKG